MNKRQRVPPLVRAGDGNRTRVIGLGSRGSTIKLRPRLPSEPGPPVRITVLCCGPPLTTRFQCIFSARRSVQGGRPRYHFPTGVGVNTRDTRDESAETHATHAPDNGLRRPVPPSRDTRPGHPPDGKYLRPGHPPNEDAEVRAPKAPTDSRKVPGHDRGGGRSHPLGRIPDAPRRTACS